MEQSGSDLLAYLGTLARTGWLMDQDPAFQSRIAEHGRWKSFAPGSTVYAVGDDPDGLYGLVEGNFDVSIPIGEGEMVTIFRAEPGSWIGDSAVLAETSRAVEVVTPVTSRMLFVPAAALRRILRDHPGDWSALYGLSHINTMRAAAVIGDLLALSPHARIARTLLRLSDADGLAICTQQELAALCGMSRTSFRRAFSDHMNRGVIHTEYGAVRILDRAALETAMRSGW
jgi:CRP-like cAMP-binding protein